MPGVGAVVDANAALDGTGSANGGLVPSTLIDPQTGQIDWSRASFRRASFRDASGSPFGALWTRVSFRCDCGLDCERPGGLDAGELPESQLPAQRGLRPVGRMISVSRQLGLEAKIWMLSGAVAIATVLAYVTLVAPLGAGPSTLDVPWWLVALGFAAAERWVVHLHFRRSTHSLSLGELPLVAGLLFLPAHELVIAGLVGSSVALAFDREIPTFKAFFNLAQFTLGTCVALFVVEGLVTVRDPLDPLVWVAIFAAVSAATLVADVCVGAAVTIAEGRLETQQRIDMLLTNWTVALSNTCLALAIAAVVAARPEGGLLLVPPTVLLMAAYRAYLSERRRNAELEFLYEATRTLSRSSEIVPELEALLARTAAAFRVGAVDLVLFSAEPNRSARSSLHRDGSRRMLEPIDEPLAESLRSLAAGLTGPVETDRIHDVGQREYFRSRGMETGVIAPAPRRGRLRRAVRHRRPRERGPQLHGRGPAAARDAHRAT